MEDEREGQSTRAGNGCEHRSAWKKHMLETKHVTREGIRYYDDKVGARSLSPYPQSRVPAQCGGARSDDIKYYVVYYSAICAVSRVVKDLVFM